MDILRLILAIRREFSELYRLHGEIPVNFDVLSMGIKFAGGFPSNFESAGRAKQDRNLRDHATGRGSMLLGLVIAGSV
jgi:hypothetical protein